MLEEVLNLPGVDYGVHVAGDLMATVSALKRLTAALARFVEGVRSRAVARSESVSLIHLVALGTLDRVGFEIPIGVRLAGAGRAGRRVRLIAEWLVVRIWIARIRAPLVWVRPLGRVWIGGGIVQDVVRVLVAGAIVGIAAGRLGKPGGRLGRFGWLVRHD